MQIAPNGTTEFPKPGRSQQRIAMGSGGALGAGAKDPAASSITLQDPGKGTSYAVVDAAGKNGGSALFDLHRDVSVTLRDGTDVTLDVTAVAGDSGDSVLEGLRIDRIGNDDAYLSVDRLQRGTTGRTLSHAQMAEVAQRLVAADSDGLASANSLRQTRIS